MSEIGVEVSPEDGTTISVFTIVAMGELVFDGSTVSVGIAVGESGKGVAVITIGVAVGAKVSILATVFTTDTSDETIVEALLTLKPGKRSFEKPRQPETIIKIRKLIRTYFNLVCLLMVLLDWVTPSRPIKSYPGCLRSDDISTSYSTEGNLKSA